MAIVHADQRPARECYVVGLKLTPTVISAKRDVNRRMVAMIDFDPRVNDEVRMELKESVEEWQLGTQGQNTQLEEA